MVKKDPPARDFMHRDVVMAPDSATVWDLAKLFAELQITGCPVVDAGGALVGVVSQTDIVKHVQGLVASLGGEFYADPEADEPGSGRPTALARDLMSRDVVQAPESTLASELSRQMLLRRIHRIIITSGGQVRGIVTTMDLLKVL